MRRAWRCLVWCVLGSACVNATLSIAQAAAVDPKIDERTWVDHDRRPIPQPAEWEPAFWGQQFRQGFSDPVAHIFDIPDKLLWFTQGLGARRHREAVNVNAFDEVPRSSWFTNRNHMRAVPIAQLRQGPDSVLQPAKPWTIKKAKQGGRNAGFQIKDADGKRWLVKLDARGHAQLSSGADMISRTLIHASGYNVPHNEPVRFSRADLSIDPELLSGAKGDKFTEADLESVLVRGAVFPDGRFSATASLFLPGKVLGAPSMNRLRPGDSNDWYTHRHRRELRGLFVVCAWLNDWDTKDHQFLDIFTETRDSLGHVEHYMLDVGASLGAAAMGPKDPWSGFEHAIDFPWTARRLLTLGFVQEPWRRANQNTGIPSVGNFESKEFQPGSFRPLLQQPAFRELTDRDGYWGAKIVASFSDAQIAAAVEAAHYDDPRASEFLTRTLIERRDKTARYWFARVAPLDYFRVEGSTLRFHDLAVDIGLEGARAYDVALKSTGGGTSQKLRLDGASLPLGKFDKDTPRLELEIRVAGNRARAAYVELTRTGSTWTVTRVRHG